MKVLSIGWFNRVSNTSYHRHMALQKNVEKVDGLDASQKKLSLKYRIAHQLFLKGLPVRLPDIVGINKLIVEKIKNNTYDVVWIDKGITTNKTTLELIKKHNPNAKIVGFSPDNMAMRHNQSQNYLESLPLYDTTFTTKSYILEELKHLGAKNVQFINKTYSEEFHYPRTLSPEEKKRFGTDVGFIGVWEKERCESILFLVKNGLRVKVFGDGKWNDYKNFSDNLEIFPGLFSDDYPKALGAFKIALCFLRKINKDQQTARTMEIPACGGFMMAERTGEHQRLFEEKKEAVYFSSDEELLNLCQYYLKHEDERSKIALSGLNRCQTSGYSNEKTMKKMLDIVVSNAK